MDSWPVIILIALAFPFMALVGFLMALSHRGRLREIEFRLRRIEERLAAPPTAAQRQQAPLPWDRPATGAPAAEAATEPAAAAGEPPPEAVKPLPPSQEEPTVAPSPEEPPAPPPPPPPTAPPRPQASFEERFGTRWVVWVGGAALALGGIFLVQYSIEQGWLGPAVRIFLGALLGASFIAAGEWLRRNEERSNIAGLPTANIPAILTAAGTTVLYADVYAAYALYGFLDPLFAFILLGAIGVATLAAALLHGPALAGLGLVGAFVAPMLVATSAPNYWALTIYLGVVTAAAFTLARARHWRWLVATTVAFGFLWMLPGIDDLSGAAVTAHAAHAAIGFILAAIFVVSGFYLGPSAEPGRFEWISSGALVAYLLAATLLVVAQHHDPLAITVFTALAVLSVGIAWRTDAAAAAIPAAAALAALVLLDWAVGSLTYGGIVLGGPAYQPVVDPTFIANQGHLWLGAGFAILFGASGYLAQARSPSRLIALLWAGTAVAAPLAILAILYYRLADFERSLPFAAVGLGLAVLFALATDQLSRRSSESDDAATAIFATGAVAALALAFTMALDKGWLSVAIALMVPGVAWVEQHYRLPILRYLVIALIALVVGRTAWEPEIVGADLGTTPIFNWLLWGYGVPALAFWLGGFLLRQRADDVPARSAESAAILFTVLTVFLEIRHYMTGGDITTPIASLAEVGLQVSSGFAMAIGLEHVRERTHSIVHNYGALIVAGLAWLAVPFRLGISENPLFTPIDVGSGFFDLILLGYGLPAILLGALALKTRETRPQWYRITAAVTAVALALAYLTLEVRHIFQGPVLAYGYAGDAEQYTYSAVWLAFGIVLLVAGIFLRSQPVRLASAAVVLLTIGKVFLIDLADLEGGFRALSFIVLGLVLVAIGSLYQRLLFPRRAPSVES
jgi:uncharacterized membrane protein